jgi:hypothetical protein
MTEAIKNKKNKVKLQYTGEFLNLKKGLITVALQALNFYTFFQLSATKDYLYNEYGTGVPIIINKDWIPDKKRSSGDFMESLAASNVFNGMISSYPKITRMLGIVAPIIATKMELKQENIDPWDIFAYWAGYLAMIGMDIALLKAVKKIVYNHIIDKLIEENQGNEVQTLAQICKEIRSLDKKVKELKWNKFDPENQKVNLAALLELAQVMEGKVKVLQNQRVDYLKN